MAEKDREDTQAPALNVWLAGFMCAGKTRTGRLLARALRRPFIDTDELLERRHGAAAGALILRLGLPAFRRLEAALVRELAARGGAVVALGGGVFPSPRWRPLLRASGVTVFLDCAWPELERRLRRARAGRPLLGGPWSSAARRARKLCESRLPGYRRAELTLDTAGLPPAAAARALAAVLEIYAHH